MIRWIDLSVKLHPCIVEWTISVSCSHYRTTGSISVSSLFFQNIVHNIALTNLIRLVYVKKHIKLEVIYFTNFNQIMTTIFRSQWPRGRRRRSVATRLLRVWVRLLPGPWMSDCCECCVLSDGGLCDEPITRSEESYRMWCVAVCDLETSWMRRPWHTGGCCAKKTNLYLNYI